MSLIYCLEDDDAIRNLILYTLNVSGFESRGFAESESFWEAMKETVPQLILLDIMLPGEDGLHVLATLRAKPATAGIPVMLATAKSTEFDKVVGLDQGADDYLVKPFGMMEMISRIKAVLRRAGVQQQSVLRMGDLAMDTSEHTVTVQGERVELTRKEYELLRLMIAHPGKVFDRENLLESVWDAGFAGETRTVDMHVSSLRLKLGPCGEYIRTIRGVGYRMEAHP